MTTKIDGSHFAAIRALVLAADSGSMTEAGRRLGLTPSAVSKQLSRLEDALGARLLERSTRRVRATTAGLELIERARPLFEAFDEAGASVRDSASAVSGRIRITASRSFGRCCLLPSLARLAEEHPQLQVDLLLDARRLDFIDDGIDLALREGPLPDSSLAARKLGEVPMRLYASPAYLEKRGTPRTLADLREHDLLSIPPSSIATDIAELRDARGRALGLVPRFRVNDLLALADLAEAGSGIAVLPVYVARPLVERGVLARVLPKETLARIAVHAVFPSRARIPRRLEVLLERLRADVVPLLKRDAREA